MENEVTTTQRHKIVPVTLVPSQVPAWIERNAKSQFRHTTKVLFTPEELDEKARRSCNSGVQMLALEEILSQVKTYCDNGLPEGEDPIIVELRPTAGNKSLKKQRAFLDKEVSLGYTEVISTVYELPDATTKTMVCLTSDGVEIPERTRPMSPKEVHEYVGLYMHGGEGMRNAVNG